MPKPGRELQGHSGNDEIGTPDDLFEWLNRRFQFDYDAFASHENALREDYSTVDGTFCTDRPLDGNPSGPSLIEHLDGFDFPWAGCRVFANPPYSAGMIMRFAVKAYAERDSAAIIVGLVKWDTSTEASRFLTTFCHVEPLPRIKYKGMAQAATFASAIVIVKPSLWRHGGQHV